MGTFSDPDTDAWHNFAGVDETIQFNLASGQGMAAYLKWDDWSSPTNDYDMYLFREPDFSTPVAWSIGSQQGNPWELPREQFGYVNGGSAGTYHLAFHRFSGAGSPTMDLFLLGVAKPIDHNVVARSILDPATSPLVTAIGAVCWATDAIKSYSSQGPNINGTLKPDLSGPDGVSGETYGATGNCNGGFTGTSASSPHVAGAAALLLQAYPTASKTDLHNMLLDLTVDAGAAGPDTVYGVGILDLGEPPVQSPGVIRLAGTNRFETAASVSAHHYPSGANTVFVATAFNFPDALAGATAAGRANSPLLLTGSTPPATAAELDRLDPDDLLILGGTAVVSAADESALGGWGNTERLAGANRYLTAIEISKQSFGDGEANVVFVATGTNFPDALAAGAAAAELNGPVLLTPPGSLPDEVAAEINRLDPDTILVIGGEAAISTTVFNALNTIKPATRIAGTNRYGTAVAISQHAFTNPAAVSRVYIAVGTNFPDALAGAAAAAAVGAPVLLTSSDSLPASVVAEINRLGPSLIYILGGTAVISTNVATQLAALLP
jgi:putative cell wall-binding protein